MKHFEKILNHKTGQQMARVMEIICYVGVGLLVAMLVLACMGRLQYDLRTAEGQYPNAIYTQDNHEFDTRGFTVSSANDQVYVHTSNGSEKVQLVTYTVIVTLFAMSILPVLGVAFLLARLFRNIAGGDIFIPENAYYLVTASSIKVMVALIIPFLKFGIIGIANKFLVDSISLGTGGKLLEELTMAILFFVAAYVIYRGSGLQQTEDEN